jgi:hypothetical protein
LVGPNVEQKNAFIEFLTGNPIPQEIHPLFSIGLEVYPSTYQNKIYNLWDAKSSKEEHLSLWGQNSKLILIFGEDPFWYNHMHMLFPETKIKFFNIF